MATKLNFDKIDENDKDYSKRVSGYFSAFMKAAMKAENHSEFESMFAGNDFIAQFNEALDAMEKNHITNSYYEEYRKNNKGELLTGMAGAEEAFNIIKQSAVAGYEAQKQSEYEEKINQFEKTAAEQTKKKIEEERSFDEPKKNDINSAQLKKDFELEPEKLLKALRDGDSLIRRSSKEYRDIENSLAVISNIMNSIPYRKGLDSNLRRRLMCVCMKSVLVKAENYVNDRKNVELTSSSESYSGRRVKIMRNICAALRAQIKVLPTKASLYMEKVDDYYACAKVMLYHTSFSNIMFSEVHSLMASHKEEYEAKMYDQTDLTRHIHNTWESSDDQMERYMAKKTVMAMAEGLEGRVVPEDKFEEMHDAIRRYHNSLRYNFNKADECMKKDKPVEEKTLQRYRDSAEALSKYSDNDKKMVIDSIKYSATDKNQLPEKEKKVFTITGDRKLDLAIAKCEVNRFKEKFDAVEKYNLRFNELNKDDRVEMERSF